MKQLLFFATNEDLRLLLSAVESQLSIKYVRMANSDSARMETYKRGSEIPNLGWAGKESASSCDEYLVVLQDQQVVVRSVLGSDGAIRYLVDQLSNPKSITFAPGGKWSEDVILHGRIATVYDDGGSQALMKGFANEIRKVFRKVKAYWVGPQAEALLDAGKRLTLSLHASREFDLAKTE